MNSASYSDKIELRDLEVETIIGVHPDERTTPQKIYVDLTLFLDLAPAGKNCDISHTVDYAALAEELRFVFQASQFLLLETAAYAVAHYVLAPPIGTARTQIDATYVSIRKPRALGDKGVPVVSISMETKQVNYEHSRGEGHHIETIFKSKDSILQRIKMIEGSSNPPPQNENYTLKDYDLKTSGPHFLRVYRI